MYENDDISLNESESSLNHKKNSKQLTPCKALLLGFVSGLITGIGGYNNKWKPLNENWGLYLYRSNLWWAYGLNKRIYNGKYIDVDLHILGLNFLSLLGAIMIGWHKAATDNTIDANDYKICDNFYMLK